jgi:hypothetical protein
MITKTLLGLVKGMLAVVAALTPASVPAIATIVVIGSTAAVTAGCAEPDDD